MKKQKTKINKVNNIIVAAIIAFIFLTFFCCFYYNIPIHSASLDGVTDYVWEGNKFFIIATEGFGCGKTNNEGYFSEINYYDDNEIDVLIMGSSHMQGMSVGINHNVSTLLSKYSGLNVYNIGTTGHNFKVCVSNLEAALKKYNPRFVVLETNRIVFDENEIENIINNNISNISSNENDLIRFFEKNPFIRWSYSQVRSFIQQNNNDSEATNIKSQLNEEKTKELINYIKTIADKSDTKVIIMFHPTIDILGDGTIKPNNKENDSLIFAGICNDNKIYYLDMTDKYLEEYKNNYIIPTGFINTGVAEGHINKFGHLMMAEELNRAIKEIDD